MMCVCVCECVCMCVLVCVQAKLKKSQDELEKVTLRLQKQVREGVRPDQKAALTALVRLHAAETSSMEDTSAHSNGAYPG